MSALFTHLPLVVVDTNVLFDCFLGRDSEILLLAGLSQSKLDIVVPEFVLMEFRGSALRQLGEKERAVNSVQSLANELERADEWNKGVDALRDGCEKAKEDIVRLRSKLDQFIEGVRSVFSVIAHSPDVHYRGDLRYVQGLPPDEPKRGVQDCRIFEAVLDIARNDSSNTSRPERLFLTKDADFFKKQGVRDELRQVGVTMHNTAGPIYGKYR